MSFEQGFVAAERAALAVERAARDVVKAAKQMERAARVGDIRKLRRAAESLATVAATARQEAANSRSAWPFSDAEERQHLEEAYEAELQSAARQAGLKMHARDERLVAYPSIVQILPGERAVKMDRKRIPTIRPSYLVAMLLALQNKKSGSKSEQFIEALYGAYKLLVPKGDAGAVLRLATVYQAFTLLPGAGSEYGRGDFARDIFLLDRSGVTRTRSGAAIALPTAPAARGVASSTFTFVAPDGEDVRYYGLQFTEEK